MQTKVDMTREPTRKGDFDLSKFYQDLQFYESNISKSRKKVANGNRIGRDEGRNVKNIRNSHQPELKHRHEKKGLMIETGQKDRRKQTVDEVTNLKEGDSHKLIHGHGTIFWDSEQTLDLDEPIVLEVHGDADDYESQTTKEGKAPSFKREESGTIIMGNNLKQHPQRSKTELLIGELRKRNKVYEEIEKQCGGELREGLERVWREKQAYAKMIQRMRKKLW